MCGYEYGKHLKKEHFNRFLSNNKMVSCPLESGSISTVQTAVENELTKYNKYDNGW